MKHCFIINPASGKGKAQRTLEQVIRQACEKEGVEHSIYYTTGVGDGERYARETCSTGEPCRLYACGGDGTLGEIVNGAAECETAEIAVIPVGTGNDFVRNFAPVSKFMDVVAQIKGVAVRLDLIKYNERYIANMLNTGFDCEVVRSVADIKKNPLIPRKLAYVAGVVKTLVKKPGVAMEVSVDGGAPIRKDLLLTCVANGSYCGGGFHSAPESFLDNGMIDVCFIKNVTRRKFVSLISSYKNGTYLSRRDAKDVAEYLTCSRLDIKFDKPQHVSIDGEVELHEKISLSCIPRALRFVIPEGCALSRPFKVAEAHK